MQNQQDKRGPNESEKDQQQGGEHRNLDDLFNTDSNKVADETPEEEAAAEQQRKEALTERD